MNILSRITMLRLQRNWTEYELAKSSGLPQSTISSWYRKNMLPSISSLEKICTGLDITLSEFFCEDGDTVTLTKRQKEFLASYNSLTNEQKEKLDIFLSGISSK